MGRIILFLFIFAGWTCASHADASSAPSGLITVNYAQGMESALSEKIETKVDVSSTANQTMAGAYTVSGTFDVPTPPLPTAE